MRADPSGRDPLLALPNIGSTLAARLREVGVETPADLARAGPAPLYRALCAAAGRRLPVCYYLYSLEGAVSGRHWSTLSDDEKRTLRRAAGDRGA